MVHALLSFAEGGAEATKTTNIQCVHMGPPFGTHRYECDAAGTASLSGAERRMIKKFVDDRLEEREAQKARLRLTRRDRDIRTEYCILPSAQRPTPAFPLWRFSCVGFVLQAYQTARIELLGLPIPLRNLDELKRFYPSAAGKLDDPKVRKQLGIADAGPWPVALVGYVLHSLNREPAVIRSAPYVPAAGDELFPRVESVL